MAKHWDYADAATSTTGLMVCTACRKKITEGQYRYRETEAEYLTQHRACCTADPMWAKMDKAEAARVEVPDEIYLRPIDGGTPNACWVVCNKVDAGAVPFVPA